MMFFVFWRGLAASLCLVACLTCHSGWALAGNAGTAPIPGVEKAYSPAFPPTGMLSLGADRLLLWDERGSIQIGERGKEWSRIAQLPVTRIETIKPDGDGFLVVDERDAPWGNSKVIAYDRQGVEVTRWIVRDVSDLLSWPGKRLAVTRAGMVPLLPEGKLGELEPFPADIAYGHPIRTRFPPTVLRWQDVTVLCYPADRSKLGFASARCARPGKEGWVFEGGDSVAPPIACGPWILLAKGKRLEHLMAINMADGRIEGSRTFKRTPVVACDGEGQLVVGTDRVERLELPALGTFEVLPTGGREVWALAVAQDFIAYRREGSLDIQLVGKRPR